MSRSDAKRGRARAEAPPESDRRAAIAMLASCGVCAWYATSVAQSPPPPPSAPAMLTAGTARLRSPFTASRPPISAPNVAAAAAPPPPQRVLAPTSYYRDGTNGSEIDPAAFAAYRAAVKPVQDFERQVTVLADAFVMSRAPAFERLARLWLLGWARADALTEARTNQGGAVAAWALAPISLAWTKIQAADATSDERRTIEEWIATLSKAVRARQEIDADRDSRNNNHAYWAAWGVMNAACAVQDPQAFAWAEAAFQRALRQVEADGVLPLELKRRSRALQYHNFALGPLVLMAETLALNGRPSPYGDADSALRRLAGFTLEGLADPAAVAARAGAAQSMDFVAANNLAWMEPYGRTVTDARIDPHLARWRPMASTRLGGNLSYYFGAGAS